MPRQNLIHLREIFAPPRINQSIQTVLVTELIGLRYKAYKDYYRRL